MKLYVVLVLLVGLVVLAESCRRCPFRIQKVNCVVNPCRGKQCRLGGRRAVCRQNRCGGCNRHWYDGGDDVTKKCEFECPDPKICYKGIPIVPNCPKRIACKDKCRFFPNAKCCPKHCGKCTAEYYFNGKLVDCNRRPTK